MQKVQMTLVGLDGNAFNLMGAFSREARRQGWPRSDVDSVLKEAMAGDYDHLLQTLMKNTTEEPSEEE